jgi:hypothetical protein
MGLHLFSHQGDLLFPQEANLCIPVISRRHIFASPIGALRPDHSTRPSLGRFYAPMDMNPRMGRWLRINFESLANGLNPTGIWSKVWA